MYAAKSQPLQLRKTTLLKGSPVAGSARKRFSAKSPVDQPTAKERASFNIIQKALSDPVILIHFDHLRTLFVDLDASKTAIGAMVYHVKPSTDISKYPRKTSIQPILFLSRLITDAETRYWPTELEMAGLVWVLRKPGT